MGHWDALCAILARHRDEADDAGRLAPAVRDAAAEHRLWLVAAPREVGGLELPVPEQLGLFEQVGAADATVGWQALDTAVTGFAAAWLEDADRRAVLGLGDRPCGAGFTSTGAALTGAGQGRFRLDGHWPSVAGSADARWCTLLAYLGVPGGRAATRWVVVPTASLEVEPTGGAASGMRGTGSHGVRARRVDVPAGRVVDPSLPPQLDRALYRWPPSSARGGTTAGLAIGVLRAAIAAAVQFPWLARRGAPADDGLRRRQALADATAAVDAQSLGLRLLAEELWEAYEVGAAPGPRLGARWWSMVAATFDLVCDHTSRLYRTSTSAVYATRNPLDRCLRDAHAIAAAAEPVQAMRRAAGDALLGEGPARPPRA